MEQFADVVDRAATSGRRTLVGRVVQLKGFSTLPVDEMVVIDDRGDFHGDLLGRPGAERLGAAARQLFGAEPRLETVGVSIHGPAVEELGLACGGQADVLLQPTSSIPDEFWSALARRAPVALITVIDGPGTAPDAVAVDRDGADWGALAPTVPAAITQELVSTARLLLGEGRTTSRRVETEVGVALIEGWVPAPRLVAVAGGDILTAIEAQAELLGWEVRGTDGPDAVAAVDGLLDWAGSTGAVIVCSHDPHVDTPVLAAALDRPTPYIGAMGSRGTQSRRMTRLAAQGISEEQLDRIHRPIGLNLGGRRASEVALAIVAEILACHCGRDGRPLKETTGPIHG